MSDLLRSQASGKGAEHFQLGRSGFLDDLGTASALLGIPLRSLFLLHTTKGLFRVGEIGSQREKRALDQFDPGVRRNMHEPTLSDHVSNSLWCVKMPDRIVTVKVERSYSDSQQRHQASPTTYRKMDTVALPFQIAKQAMDSIQGAISMLIIGDICNGVAIQFKGMRVKMDGVRRQGITAGKLAMKAQQGMIKPGWRLGPGVQDNDFANGKASLQEQIQRKRDDLRLAAQRCD
jgi:hypothetical protein